MTSFDPLEVFNYGGMTGRMMFVIVVNLIGRTLEKGFGIIVSTRRQKSYGAIATACSFEENIYRKIRS